MAEKASPKEGAIPKKCAPPKKQIAAKGKTLAVSPRKEAKATKKTVQPALAKDSAMPAIRAYEIKKCFFIGDWVAGLDGRQIAQRYAAISVVNSQASPQDLSNPVCAPPPRTRPLTSPIRASGWSARPTT